MTYQTYEFTAFTEADLLQDGDHNLGCGDSFTMPGSATTCISVTDNDGSLSGDNRRNENANDKHGQNAAITGEDGNELGNGGQIYAEKYWWVCDTAGNWYVMIEIEQEGSNDDYFAFYNGYGYSTPEPGTELTVYSSCNVKGNWVDYNCLDAGEKEEPNPWVLDDECVYTIQAEDFDLHGFHVVDGAQAAGGELVKISGHDGKISTEFGGETGVYNLTICAQDECDGASKLMVYVNGEFQETIKLQGQETTIGDNNHGFSAFTLNGLEIVEGDVVEIRAWRDGNEFVRIDEIKFEQVKFEECDLEGAVKLDFEEFAAGDILGTQIDGVTISAMGGSGDAMIFDSQNPTGGDGDLETRATQQGNVLIVSEDGDSSDPDDVVGGKITFDFDNPSTIFDLKFIDTEEGGTVTLTLADGSTQTFDIPELVNGGVGQLVMNVEDVVQMMVQLDGSGAIDDLCYVPGEEPLGALSGRYFCDVDRDGTENDGNGGFDVGVAGATVWLLDAAGNIVGTTTTDSDGNYRFDDLAAGQYSVRFEDPADVAGAEGKTFIAPNQDNDDTTDSDVESIGNAGDGNTGLVTVIAGEETMNVDAGIEAIPGSLSGRYFCDDDRDGLDNDGANNGLAGVTVVLLDSNDDPAVDIDGNTIASIVTDANGNYSFGNLAAGSYSVKFTDDSGKILTTQNVDGDASDDIDSDAADLGNGMSQIDGIVVVAGENTPDNDAGVFEPNTPPVANDDMGKLCATESVMLDVLGNDMDADGDALSVGQINGIDVMIGDMVSLSSGGVVTVNADGTLSYDSSAATYDGIPANELLIGEMKQDSFTYTATDGSDTSGSATVSIKVIGALNTIDTIDSSLDDAGCVKGTLSLSEVPGEELYTFSVTEVEFATSHIGEVLTTQGSFDLTFCLSIATPIDPAPTVNEFTLSVLDAASYSDAIAGAVDVSGAVPDFGFNPDNADNVNWLLNQADTFLMNGYTEGDMQRAIWNLVDGGADSILDGTAAGDYFDARPWFGDEVKAAELTTLALANDGFVARSGDIVGVVLDPKADGVQPLVIGVEFDKLAQDCDDFLF